MLFTMAAGLAVGVGSFGYAVLFTVVLCLLMMLLSRMNFGGTKTVRKQLKITVPEDLSYEEAFAEVFRAYNVGYELRKVRTTELGSLYEVVYLVEIDHLANQKQLLDALRCRNGNLDIALTMVPTAAEF